MTSSDLDARLEEFLDELKSKGVDDRVVKPFNDLVNLGADENKLLDLIGEEVGEEERAGVKALLASGSSGEPVGIGGWMILPLIGLFLTPLFSARALLVDIAPMFDSEVWRALTVPGGAGYHPAWAPIGYVSFGANVLLVAGSITLIYFMFRKLAIFPKGMVVFYLFIFTVSVAEFLVMQLVMADAFPGMMDELQSELTRGLARAFVGIVIWVPYFMTSQRVKNTFVN